MWREQAEKAQQDLEAIKAEFECFKADHLTALDALQQKINTKDSTIQDLQTMLERRPQAPESENSIASQVTSVGNEIPRFPPPGHNEAIWEEAEFWWNEIWPRVCDRFTRALCKDPVIANLLIHQVEFVVGMETRTVNLTDETLKGKLAGLVAEGYFDKPMNGNSAYNELKRRGVSVAKPNVYRELDNLSGLGLLTKEDGGYQRVPGIKITKTAISNQ